jgi:hypothetical protein
MDGGLASRVWAPCKREQTRGGEVEETNGGSRMTAPLPVDPGKA